MRDIRPDLRERLSLITSERKRLDEVEARLNDLLRTEEIRWTLGKPDEDDVTEHSSNGNGGTPNLKDFILGTLNRVKRPMTIDELKDAASEAGMTFGNRAPGRVLHRAATGMIQQDLVERHNGKWRLREGRN